MKWTKWTYPPLIAAVAFASLGQTAPQPGSGQDDKELTELLGVLKQETEVATRTRLNSDYVPGIVTVLESEQLEALGVATAGEAIALVPGMQAVFDIRSDPAAIVRGIDFPFNNGNIQVLVNSIPLSRSDAGINSSVLLIPVEQIERIEVIRGPGSVLYGDFAFMGLVNIVTKRHGAEAFGRAGSRFREAGARASWGAGGGELSGSVSHGWSDDTPAIARDIREDRWFSAASYDRGGFSAKAQMATRGFMPSVTPGPPHFSEQSSVIDLRYGREVRRGLRVEGSVEWLGTDIDETVSDFRGDQMRAAVTVVADQWAHQSILAGADSTWSNVSRARHANPPLPGQQPGPATDLPAEDRRILGLTLQDRIDLTRNVGVTLGARYDAYSDLDSRITPRAAIVWRATDSHIVKAQYAEGFRPPTFFELYSPPIPNARYPFEVNATTELNYVYRAAARVGRVTLFHSRIHDMLRPGGFVTPGAAVSKGYELEWSQHIASTIRVDANASHVDTKDPRSSRADERNAVTANWLGNLALIVEPMPRTIFAAWWNHVGDRIGGNGYDLASLTFTRRELVVSGLAFRAGVKNVFNSDVRYLTALPTGGVSSLLFPRRTFWAELAWRK